jgi:hypothetical protein
MTPREEQLSQLLAESQSALAEARRENALLRQKIDLLVRRVFGSSSEQLDRAQLELLLAGSQMPESPTVCAEEKLPVRTVSPARKSKTPRLPDHLPVVEEVIDPEPVKAQPESWRCIGQEISEQLDYEPGRFLRRRTVRRKYVQRDDPEAAPLIAPLPEDHAVRAYAAQRLAVLDALGYGTSRAEGGDPSTLNLASITQANCLKSCTWVRTLHSAATVPVKWAVTVGAPPPEQLVEVLCEDHSGTYQLPFACQFVDGQWRIKTLKLTRLRRDVTLG